MKFTDKENTVIADLGINTDYSNHPVQATKDVMNILGTTAAGAKAILRSLDKKGVLETIGEDEDELIQFTEKGIEVVNQLNPPELDIEEDDVPTGDDDDDLDDIEFLDDDDEDEPVTMVKQAAKKAKDKAKKAPKASTAGTRTSHADCSHPSQGKEGKIARAKCRKERAAAAAKANA